MGCKQWQQSSWMGYWFNCIRFSLIIMDEFFYSSQLHHYSKGKKFGSIIKWNANGTEWIETDRIIGALTNINGFLYSSTGGSKNKITKWNANGTIVHEWDVGNGWIEHLTSMDGLLYSAYHYEDVKNCNKIIKWDANNGTKVHEWDTGSTVLGLIIMDGFLYSSQLHITKGKLLTKGKKFRSIIKWDANSTQLSNAKEMQCIEWGLK